jgi:mycofactocin biosynthetic radical S-adenosylmethionine protein MftC
MDSERLEVLRVPHDVYVILTSRCNLRCLHCYGSFGEPHLLVDELTATEWIHVFDQLSQLRVFYVNIAGGEPTLHPGFPELIDHLGSIGMHYILTTNGLCSDRAIDALRRTADYAVGVKISLDGPTPDSHARIRVGPDFRGRANYFHRTMETIWRLRSEDRVPITIATCLHDQNVMLIPEFVELIKEIRPVSWFLSTIAPTGRAKDHYGDIYAPDSYHDESFWSDVAAECRLAGVHVRYIDMPTASGVESAGAGAFSCPAASSFCEINSDGVVSPCPLSRVNMHRRFLDFPNVRTSSIADIWASDSFGTFRSWRTSGCDGCNAFGGCGRCVAQSAEWYEGDVTLPPPICVEHGEALGLPNVPALRERVRAKQAAYATGSCGACAVAPDSAQEVLHDSRSRRYLPIVQAR